jgi:hypothetical protein
MADRHEHKAEHPAPEKQPSDADKLTARLLQLDATIRGNSPWLGNAVGDGIIAMLRPLLALT